MNYNSIKTELSGDLISRDAVLKEINCWIGSGEYRYAMSERFLIDRIKTLPPVTAEPKTGHWIKDDITERSKSAYKHKCDRCGAYHRAMYDYCPSCGARMESEDDNT